MKCPITEHEIERTLLSALDKICAISRLENLIKFFKMVKKRIKNNIFR